MTKEENSRYERQLLVSDFGEEGQRRLAAGRVLVVGAGGLGSAALQYLCAGGVGHVGIVEYDTVSLSNLQRQTLYTTADLGAPKAEIAARRLSAINPNVKITAYPLRLTEENSEAIFRDYDVVVDCTDNYAARYVIDRQCGLSGIPMVYGTAQEASGQVSVFHWAGAGSYAALYPEQVVEAGLPVGVLSPMPGIVGSIEAMETFKILTGYGRPLAGQLLMIDAREMTFTLFKV
jgi:adenylyltransferase/sulfurtransferase